MKAAKNKRVVVIGSGFAGLSAACNLAKEGFEVTILEKNSVPGGRARKFEAQGFMFDMGPSWYWMPDVFEAFFEKFGKKVSDYYGLHRLDPSYQVIFSKGDKLKMPASMPALEAMFESIEAGSSMNLRKFLKEAAYKYQVGMGVFVRKPSKSIMEFVDWRVISSLFRLDMFKPMSKHVRSLFKDERLRKILEFPVLFLGATPEKTPALYSLMNHADLSLGTWYPMGGMYQIVDAMVQLAIELGVKIELNQEVVQVDSEAGVATKATTSDGTTYQADFFVGAADYHHIETSLLKTTDKNYSDQYWEGRTMAPSCLLWYLGINKKLEGLLHHNLFFDEDLKQHATEIYEQPKWPEKPLFYVCAPSVTDASVAPEGSENLFVLMPVAPGLKDTSEVRARYFNLIMDRLEKLTNQSIRTHIVFQRSYAHADFVADYHAFKGNAYGLANTLMQTAFLKPSLKNKRLRNFWYTGQLTVPGPGVPPAIISGQVVAEEILKSSPN
ncbi:MAG: phytoene desaturase [Saprospiraceae bacterium]|nr:phytoene desaturase [Saprospiraceae bacterium]